MLVKVKPRVLKTFSVLLRPFKRTGLFVISTIFVPLYHVFYIAKKQFDRAWRPAKNRFMVFVTNRYAIHVTISIIALVAVGLNIGTQEVRAEVFGEQSLMYALATDQDSQIIEEYASDNVAIAYAPVSYREQTGISAFARNTDGNVQGTLPVSVLGGGALTTPTISEGAESVAPRTDVEIYVVKGGDTLSTIASQFGISLNTLLWANDLTVRSVLKPGVELEILPTTGVQHTVDAGDTVASIAKEYDATEEDIIAFNRLADAEDLIEGENIIVPDGIIVAAAPVRDTSIISVFDPVTDDSSQGAVIAPVDPPPASTNVSGTGAMIWPTDLYVITQYFGWNHTGIDIDCKFTNNNYAADDGIVQYSGWKNGYGYTVEINHGNGLVTRYGHHAQLYVSTGDQVTKGQAVGLCGTTGYSTGTHLHFEVIRNGSFQNPLEYIR